MKSRIDQNNHSNSMLTKTFVYGALAVWFLFALVMGAQGRYQTGAQGPPLALGLTFALPILLFVLAYSDRGAFWEFCQTLDLRVITGVHVFRFIGVDFVLHYIKGSLPAGFALPAGIGDTIVALTAIPLAVGLAKGTTAASRRFVAWNIFGLLDLVLAMSLGILHSPSTFGILAGSGPTTLLMSELPLSLVPTFFVPVYILLHLLSLARRDEVLGHALVSNLATQPS